jgi:hypothetical protein
LSDARRRAGRLNIRLPIITTATPIPTSADANSIDAPEQIATAKNAITPDPANTIPEYKVFIKIYYRQEWRTVVIFMIPGKGNKC